jgi:HTH-type transcriptional regulator, sugar sensing transcriptional regulator
MINNDIILKLTQLGFSSYEAKVYYALLQKSPAIGYEISKIAHIPTAKIYEVLNNLKNKEVIFASASEPVVYMPVAPDILLKRLRRNYDARIDELSNNLVQVQPLASVDLTWNLKGRKTIIEKMITLIDQAQQSLLLSVWPEEILPLEQPIALAKQRGVEIIAAVFGKSNLEGAIDLESCGVTSHKRLGSRLTVMIADSNEVIISEMETHEAAVGVNTNTPCIVLVAKEYIKHDIWGHFLVEALGEPQFQRMCANNPVLANIINQR